MRNIDIVHIAKRFFPQNILILGSQDSFCGCKWSQIFTGWVVLATSCSAGRVDVGAELCRFISLPPYTRISKIPPPRPDPIFPTQRIQRGRERILSTQRIPRGQDPIFSTQISGYANASPLGVDVEEIGHFQR